MITNISYNNFKCLDGKSFSFKKLNILSGYNGRGKSSVLQALLLLAQSARDDAGSLTKLHLKGNFVDLGDYYEILTDDKNSDVSFDITSDNDQFQSVKLGYTLSDEDFKVGKIRACEINGIDYFSKIGSLNDTESHAKGDDKILNKGVPSEFNKLLKSIHFISADRRGPVKYVERNEIPDDHKIDPKGENVINTIASYTDFIPACMGLALDSSDVDLKYALSQWMMYIMDGGKVDVSGNTDENKKSPVLSLNFNINDSARGYSSYNVGFGYSYILAIVLTALIAKTDSIVIIENPEAHLHGRAQSRLTELLSKLAARGVQVFVETHSEHIINGFRKEMLKNNCSLTNEDAAIYFFDADFSIVPLKVERNGRIPNWPHGFFDQETYDMAEIMRLGALVK